MAGNFELLQNWDRMARAGLKISHLGVNYSPTHSIFLQRSLTANDIIDSDGEIVSRALKSCPAWVIYRCILDGAGQTEPPSGGTSTISTHYTKFESTPGLHMLLRED